MESLKTTIEPVAFIRTDYKEKFGIPRQSGRAEGIGKIVFYPKYRNPDALRRIEEFSHLWLIFDFSQSHIEEFRPTVRPPRLGGNEKVGVFASRSPFRPNSIGLSSVKLLEVRKTENEGTVLIVSGADLLDKTPIYDIKPYLPMTDIHTDAKGGYAQRLWTHSLDVSFADESLKTAVPPHKLPELIKALSDDPRPAYKKDSDSIYGMHFDSLDVRFMVQDNLLTVVEIVPD